jgi:opacity protein-like surface antigen
MDIVRPDQRPPLVGTRAAADSLWGPSNESRRGDGIAESRRAELEDLVRRFTPTLVLPKADHTTVNGKKYQLIPTNAHLLADTLRLDKFRASPYSFQDAVDIPLYTLSADSIISLTESILRYESDPDLLVAAYFDWPGESAKDWWKTYGEFRTGLDSARWGQPTVYAHPFLDSNDRVVIQYWFFYPFNDHVGNHEGDWEHINVVLSPDRSDIERVHYYFHTRSVNLPQGKYKPEIINDTHPLVYVGGRMYNLLDFPIRLVAGEHNEGAHGTYPYPGEWEGSAGLGAPESVQKPDKDSSRVVPYHRFRVVLMPEPGRIDYRNKPEIIKEWGWLLLPVRWGFPSVASFASELQMDVGNRAPFGPPFNEAWNRTAPGLHYPVYHVRKMSWARSFFEDLLQPWYYPYIFRTPRYVHDTRGGLNRQQLAQLGLAAPGGWAEKGLGSPIMGVHLGFPSGKASDVYNYSTGISLSRNLWAKLRLGSIELLAGYQKFSRGQDPDGSLFIYPITANYVLRAPDALFRPYVSVGGGAYGWESRIRAIDNHGQYVFSGWSPGWNVGVGIEYYLRVNVALDVGLRYHSTQRPGSKAGMSDDQLRFYTLWIGHYFRF